MKCERCQVHEARFAVLNYYGQDATEIHICQDCMVHESNRSMPVPIKHFVSWIIKNIPPERLDIIFSQNCLSCGNNFREFTASGFIGCDDCHQFFKPVIRHLAKIMAKNYTVPSKTPLQSWDEQKREAIQALQSTPVYTVTSLQIERLKERLEALIQDERYEDAKKLDEQIKQMSA